MDTPWTRLRREGSEGSKGSEGRVDGALGPEGCGRLPAAGCVSLRSGGREKVLPFTLIVPPLAGGRWYVVPKGDGPEGPVDCVEGL